MTDETPPRIRENTKTTDIGQARSSLSDVYAGISWAAEETDRDFAYRYAAAGDASMTIRAITFDGHLEGEMPAGDDFVVAHIHRGTGILDVGKTPIALQTGKPQLWPVEAFQFDFHDYDQRLIQINRHAVERVLAERGQSTSQIRFDHEAEPTDAARRQWQQTVNMVAKTVLDPSISPALQSEMGRISAIALLDMYPVHTADLPAGLLVPKNGHIRLAVEYIHEHPHLPITTTDLAQIANVSLRTLQETFQRLLGVTPNTYLRHVRLDRIHHKLTRADPSTTVISDVARTWGFSHPGRFAAAYEARFGCYPRDTLSQTGQGHGG